MPATAIKSSKKARTKSPSTIPKLARSTNGTADVLTLAEAAEYLRVSETDVLAAIAEQSLPARQVGKDWRILKSALQQWLLTPQTRRNFWETQLGALSDDPDLDTLLEETYRKRGQAVGREI